MTECLLFNLLELNKVIGMNKKQVRTRYGLQYNDINSNRWIYRIENIATIKTSNKYLYLYFENNILMKVRFSKRNRFYSFIYNNMKTNILQFFRS